MGAALVVLAGALAGCSGDDGSAAVTTTTTTSAPTSTSTTRVPVEANDADLDLVGDRSGPWEIVYLVEDLVDADAAPVRERVVVRPPFDSRLEGLAADEDGAEVTSVQVSTFDRLRVGGPSDPLVVQRVPGLAVSDVRLAPVLRAGIEAGLIEVVGRDQVAGRPCLEVRTGTLLGAGHLQAMGGDEEAVSCVDADGLVLRETLVIDGEPSLRRTAIEVRVGVEPDEDDFDVEGVLAPVDQGGGSVLPVDPDRGALGDFWVLPDGAVPDGMSFLGRWAVVEPSPERFSGDPERGTPVAGTVDVWVDGARLLVLYQGGTRDGDVAHRAVAEAVAVDAGELGEADLVLSATASEVRATPGGGRFVHVIGTLDPDALVRVAVALARTTGEGLEYL